MLVQTIFASLLGGIQNAFSFSVSALDTLASLTTLQLLRADRIGPNGYSLFCIFVVPILMLTTLYYLCRKVQQHLIKESRLRKLPTRQFTERRVIVVGSGILGSCMATVLARDGIHVTLIERDMREPDRIIGELLQPGGCEVLVKLGLGDCLSCDEAQPVTGYVIHDWKTGASVHIPYPKDAENISKPGRAFRHGKFIMSLRSAAMDEPNVEVIEGTVQQLIEDNETVVGVKYKDKITQETQEIYAPLVIVADGGFSRLRKNLHDNHVHVSSHFVGYVMRDCPQIRESHAELVLSDPNPILIYRISEEETRVLVDIKSQTLPKNLREHLLENVLPYLPKHLAEPFEDGVLNERIRSMPCKFLPPSTVRKNGVLMLGDAFNMRHPLTGGGMSVAFNDIYIWRELLRKIPDLTNYRQVDKAHSSFQNKRKMTHSFAVNILAQALYELFSASDEHLSRLRDACFEYFKLGGRCVDGPVGLLSVLSPDPLTLIGHFFAVALYSMWLIIKDSGYRVHIGVYKAARCFAKACQVIFPLIWSEISTIS